jgi:hypothetical protein
MSIRLFRLVLAMVIGMSVFGAGASTIDAAQETHIVLKPGMPPDGAWPAIERWMRELDRDPADRFDDLQEHLDRLVELGEKDEAAALDLFLNNEIYWGYVDLDGDGTDEMLVYIDITAYCGSFGCGTLALHRSDHGWTIGYGLNMTNPGDLCYQREGPNGRPLYRSTTSVVWWDGSHVRGVCYYACEGWGRPSDLSEHYLSSLRADERRFVYEMQRRPWCAPETAS